MNKKLTNPEIEKMYEDGVGEVIDGLGSLVLKISHILPSVSLTLFQHRADLVTGLLTENGSFVFVRISRVSWHIPRKGR